MANTLWSRTRGGSSGARVFAAYVALVLVVAMVGPGLTVYASEGGVGEGSSTEETAEPALESTGAEPELSPESGSAPGPQPEIPGPPAPQPEVSLEEPVMMATYIGPEIVPLASVAPVFVPGNPALGDGGIKLDPPAGGTFHYDDFLTGDNELKQPGVPLDFWLTIDIYDGGTTFSFTSNYPIVEVVVKGGPDAHRYIYPGGTYGDEGLLSPANPGGNIPELSHMIFYFGTIEEPETGDLAVFKFLDANENSEYDDGEEMLPGWVFSLYDDEDVLVGTGTTDAFGKISFTGLPLGEYYVTETLKDGWDNTTDLTQYVTVVGDGTVQELWFGNTETELPPETGDLMIYKFEDDNENGVHDPGEAMLADWEFTVTLESDPIAARALGPSAVMLVGSGLTDGDGELGFTGLLPNTYTVTETPKPGWDNITPLVQTVEVAAGQTAEIWFGNVPEEEGPETGDLIIYKYNDLNRNGMHDAGEPMLKDWEFAVTREIDIQLEDIAPSAVMLIGSGVTDAHGELHFGGLFPGEYTVTETPQDGWDNITPLVQTVQVVAGETAEVWFGNAEQFLPFTWLDLAITKLADRETASEGALITYTLTYWNNGNIAAENFTIVDDFDERYVSVVNANGGVVSGGTIAWTLAGPLTMEAGKQTLTYTVRVSNDMPAGTTNVDNTVVISHPRDEDPSNNTAKERVVIRVNEPFLPFTGGEFALLLGFAAAVGGLGLLLRVRTDSAA